jgi:hypothetical protein
VPQVFFKEDYRLDKSLFTIGSQGSPAQVKDFDDNIAGYLEIVEANLVRNI